MIRKSLEKLKNHSGESIAETLVAMLISTLALLVLAGAITTATNLISKSSTSLDEYYSANNNLDNGSGTSSSTATVTVAGSDTSSSSADAVTWVKCSVTTYENTTIGSNPVIAYRPAE